MKTISRLVAEFQMQAGKGSFQYRYDLARNAVYFADPPEWVKTCGDCIKWRGGRCSGPKGKLP
jgi:hypothetical protein